MKYIEEMLDIKIKTKKWNDIQKLPYYLTDEYTFESVDLDDFPCLFIKPKDTLCIIGTLKKHISAIQKVCTCPVVLKLDAISRQKQKSLIQEKIPFVVENKQIYLPFMGILLKESFTSEKKSFTDGKLIPSAQMLLFLFIYNKCTPIYIKNVGDLFGFTPMTMSRAARQLFDLGLLNMEQEGRSIVLTSELSPKKLFENAKDFLIDPVRKTVYIDVSDISNDFFFAGETALSMISMLNNSSLKTYATAKSVKTLKYSDTLYDNHKQVALEIWRYDPTVLSKTNVPDILSLAVSMKDQSDDRIQIQLKEILTKELGN